MNMIMRPAGEPSPDLGGFVGGIVVHDDMDVEPFGQLSLDLLEEDQELGHPVATVALADDEARGDIEGGEYCRRRSMSALPELRHSRSIVAILGLTEIDHSWALGAWYREAGCLRRARGRPCKV